MRKNQQGFTLIELVVVITILGILAAFAIPRFAALDTAARVSSASAMAGTLRSAAALAHAQFLVGGSVTGPISMEGTSVAMTNGYPDAITGIQAAIQDTSGFTVTAGTATTAATFSPKTTSTPTTCVDSYSASTGAGIAPVITSALTAC